MPQPIASRSHPDLASASSYGKGDAVSPESLDALWAAVRSGNLEAGEERRGREDDADAEHARRMLSRSVFKERGTLSSLLSIADTLWPGRSFAAHWSKGEAARPPAARLAPGTVSGRTKGVRTPKARPGRAPAGSPASAPPPAWGGWAAAVGAGLVLLAAFWLRRRRADPAGEG